MRLEILRRNMGFKMEKKYLTKNAGICYSEILILIVAMFAFSYIYSDSSDAIEEVLGDLKNSENLRKDLIMDQIIEKSLEKQREEQDEIVNNFLEYESYMSFTNSNASSFGLWKTFRPTIEPNPPP